MFPLQNVVKPCVLLCFRSRMLKKHWFYCVCASTCCKTTCFVVFSLPYVAKTLFLLCLCLKLLNIEQCSLCLRSKTHYNVLLRIVLCISTRQPPIFTVAICCPIKNKTHLLLTFMETPERNENSYRDRRPAVHNGA